jgi:hypothetical protein
MGFGAGIRKEMEPASGSAVDITRMEEWIRSMGVGADGSDRGYVIPGNQAKELMTEKALSNSNVRYDILYLSN